MADVITRFKLETTQFDSKLRDESRRLTDLTKHLQLAGNDFNKFAANSVEVPPVHLASSPPAPTTPHRV